ncbi:MAG: hypothetical protein ACKOE6_07840 [Flammeovirgaceae bacterium]
MKRIVATTVILLSLSMKLVYAQYDLGDAELNQSITTIITKAKTQFSEFKTFITQNYGVGRDKYDMWQNSIGMNLGDIYLAVEIAKVSRKSQDDVIASFKKNKAQGWGAIAKEFGVQPGSDAFEVLKGHAYQKANGKPRPVAARPKPKTTKPAAKKTTPAKNTKKKATEKPKN